MSLVLGETASLPKLHVNYFTSSRPMHTTIEVFVVPYDAILPVGARIVCVIPAHGIRTSCWGSHGNPPAPGLHRQSCHPQPDVVFPCLPSLLVMNTSSCTSHHHAVVTDQYRGQLQGADCPHLEPWYVPRFHHAMCVAISQMPTTGGLHLNWQTLKRCNPGGLFEIRMDQRVVDFDQHMVRDGNEQL